MVLVFSLFFSVAMADAIEMFPDECPNGSGPYNSHAGSWCQASTCESTSECEDGDTCEEYALCVTESEVPCDSCDWGCECL